MSTKLWTIAAVVLLLSPCRLCLAWEGDADADAAAPPKVGKPIRTARNASPHLAVRQLDPSIAASGLVRIKDIADVQGVRGNQLIGYGLVVGLQGTGDGTSSVFTIQSIANMLRKFGVNVSATTIQVKNVAAVMVTADLPAFVKNGSKIDVNVGSLGDSTSLQGGVLLQTPLRAANGEIYAVAQGNVSIGGFNFGSGGTNVQKNHVTAGRIPHGAYVEQDVSTTISDGGSIQITLRDPDFTTSSRMATAIMREMPGVSARSTDAATVTIGIPADQTTDLVGFISKVETIGLTPDVPARIVVNERTGTVVMGGNVRLAAGAIAHGSISIKIDNTPIVVPATSFTKETAATVVPLKQVSVEEKPGKLAVITPTSSVDQLVRALNALGVTPRDLISILQGMYAAGMISAEIEVQ